MRCLFRAFYVAIVAVVLSGDIANGQRLGFVTGREPHGVDVYDMAMTPSMRKWQYPQSLYNFYRWTGEEYSNYAAKITSDTYPPSWKVSAYDMYGNYITRGFEIFDWTIDSPATSGSIVRKGAQMLL